MHSFSCAGHPFHNITINLKRIYNVTIEIFVIENYQNMPLFRHNCYHQRKYGTEFFATRRVYHDGLWMTSAKQRLPSMRYNREVSRKRYKNLLDNSNRTDLKAE